ncbi:hypothetical protein [Streptomyces sp. NPDC002122]|uniref:hypothetical protein n=1 Tax=Streptomyces sp. NPDC002122 TaxID=3154407 RepID=UPI0033262789
MAREADRSPDPEQRHQQTAARAPLPASEAPTSNAPPGTARWFSSYTRRVTPGPKSSTSTRPAAATSRTRGPGCAERLTRLAQVRFGQNANHRFRITIRAHHLYQPQHLQNAAQVSQQVNQQLGANGITVTIG